MTKNEFQILHNFTDEKMDLLSYIRDLYNSKITKISQGTFYEQTILSVNKDYDKRTKEMFPSESEKDIELPFETWEVYYNK